MIGAAWSAGKARVSPPPSSSRTRSSRSVSPIVKVAGRSAAATRLGPRSGPVEAQQGGGGRLARRLGRDPPQGRRTLLHRGRARARLGLSAAANQPSLGKHQGQAAPSGTPGGAVCGFRSALALFLFL